MKTIEVVQFEKHTLILEPGIDYDRGTLEPVVFTRGKLLHVPADELTKIAQRNGFDKWSWTGHECPQNELEGKTGIKVQFRKYR